MRGRSGRWPWAAALLLVGCATADPVPDPAPPEGCPDGQVDDGGSCVPETCGVGAWGWLDGVDPDEVLHVSVDAAPDGDGSRAAPLSSVQEAIELAATEGPPLVALAAGSWRENLELETLATLVEVRGRCLELVELNGGDDAPIMQLGAVELTVSGVTLRGGAWGVTVDPPGQSPATVTLRDLRLTGSETVGLAIFDEGAVVTLERVVVDGIRGNASGQFGVGIDVERGATVDLRSVRIEQTEGIGLFFTDPGTTVTGDGVVVEGVGGMGLQLQSSASFDVDSLRVADTVPTAVAPGVGIQVVAASRLVARGLELDGNVLVGLLISDSGSEVELSDSVVRRTLRPESGSGGQGIALRDGAQLVATDLLLEENEEAGLVLVDAGTRGSLVRPRVIGSGAGPLALPAHAVAVYNGAALEATDLVIEDSWGTGLVGAGPGALVTLDGGEIRSTSATDEGEAGHGVHLQSGATLIADGLLVEQNTRVSVGAMGVGTRVELTDCEVRGTRSSVGGYAGRGIGVEGGAALVALRVDVVDSRQLGVGLSGVGTTGELTDCRISATRPAIEPGGGMGLVVEAGAEVLATRLEATGNEGPGAVAQSGGRLELIDAVLDDNAFAGAVALDAGWLRMQGGTVGSVRSSSEWGGGVGLFSWDVEAASTIEVEGVAFSDLPGPGLYLRGAGSYRVTGSSFVDSGGWSMPGGIFACEGVGRWAEAAGDEPSSGLLVEQSSFSALGADGILLDDASVTLSGNQFDGLEGLDLYAQRCEDAQPPLVDGADAAEPWCQASSRITAPRLEYVIYLQESGMAD
jgi:hypothetical protein